MDDVNEEVLKTPDPDLVLAEAFTNDKRIELHARKETPEETCPYCGEKSKSAYSTYRKITSGFQFNTIANLAGIGNPQCKWKDHIELGFLLIKSILFLFSTTEAGGLRLVSMLFLILLCYLLIQSA